MKKFSLPKPKALDVIFAETNPVGVLFELTLHCHEKERNNQPLSDAEQNFCWLSEMGSSIVGEGFVSIYNQFFTPHSFTRICDVLEEVEGLKLRELLREAWSIYTKDKHPITQEELQSISVRRFNTREKMNRFDEIGDEVVSELENQLPRGKVWAVEYAKRHRSEFTPH
ncbi:hypothetical protein ACXR0O_09405 [Verrucomicrobiota bacterium sgz303538]